MVTNNYDNYFNPIDAIALLEQIEGIQSYFQTLGTRSEEDEYQEIIVMFEDAKKALKRRINQ